MGTPKVMRLINPSTGKMECRVCGAIHYSNIRPDSGGQFYKGSWQCRYGCRLEDTNAPVEGRETKAWGVDGKMGREGSVIIKGKGGKE